MSLQEFYNTNPNSNSTSSTDSFYFNASSKPFNDSTSEPPMVFHHPPTPPGKAGVGSFFGSPGGSEEGIKILPNKTMESIGVVMSPATIPPSLPAKFAEAASPPLKPTKHPPPVKQTNSTSTTRSHSTSKHTKTAPPSAHSTATSSSSSDDTVKIRHVELERLSRSKLVSLLLRSESKEHDARNLLHSAIDQLSRLDGKYHTAVDRAYGLEERARGTERELEGVKREKDALRRVVKEREGWERTRVRLEGERRGVEDELYEKYKKSNNSLQSHLAQIEKLSIKDRAKARKIREEALQVIAREQGRQEGFSEAYTPERRIGNGTGDTPRRGMEHEMEDAALRSARARIGELERQIEGLSHVREDVSAERQQLQAELERARESLMLLEVQKRSLEERLESRVRELEERLRETEDRKREADEKASRADGEVASLRGEKVAWRIAISTESLRVGEEDNRRLKNENDSLQQDKRGWRSNCIMRKRALQDEVKRAEMERDHARRDAMRAGETAEYARRDAAGGEAREAAREAAEAREVAAEAARRPPEIRVVEVERERVVQVERETPRHGGEGLPYLAMPPPPSMYVPRLVGLYACSAAWVITGVSMPQPPGSMSMPVPPPGTMNMSMPQPPIRMPEVPQRGEGGVSMPDPGRAMESVYEAATRVPPPGGVSMPDPGRAMESVLGNRGVSMPDPARAMESVRRVPPPAGGVSMPDVNRALESVLSAQAGAVRVPLRVVVMNGAVRIPPPSGVSMPDPGAAMASVLSDATRVPPPQMPVPNIRPAERSTRRKGVPGRPRSSSQSSTTSTVTGIDLVTFPQPPARAGIYAGTASSTGSAGGIYGPPASSTSSSGGTAGGIYAPANPTSQGGGIYATGQPYRPSYGNPLRDSNRDRDNLSTILEDQSIRETSSPTPPATPRNAPNRTSIYANPVTESVNVPGGWPVHSPNAPVQPGLLNPMRSSSYGSSTSVGITVEPPSRSPSPGGDASHGQENHFLSPNHSPISLPRQTLPPDPVLPVALGHDVPFPTESPVIPTMPNTPRSRNANGPVIPEVTQLDGPGLPANFVPLAITSHGVTTPLNPAGTPLPPEGRTPRSGNVPLGGGGATPRSGSVPLGATPRMSIYSNPRGRGDLRPGSGIYSRPGSSSSSEIRRVPSMDIRQVPPQEIRRVPSSDMRRLSGASGSGSNPPPFIPPHMVDDEENDSDGFDGKTKMNTYLNSALGTPGPAVLPQLQEEEAVTMPEPVIPNIVQKKNAKKTRKGKK
ncbi:hypothetical protein BDQ17DRAFT_1363806 [Cyathus striatus]|nr:hypothetical protein BDQ17DRAFT_1363806 [Cyathus striatus]